MRFYDTSTSTYNNVAQNIYFFDMAVNAYNQDGTFIGQILWTYVMEGVCRYDYITKNPVDRIDFQTNAGSYSTAG